MNHEPTNIIWRPRGLYFGYVTRFIDRRYVVFGSIDGKTVMAKLGVDWFHTHQSNAPSFEPNQSFIGNRLRIVNRSTQTKFIPNEPRANNSTSRRLNNNSSYLTVETSVVQSQSPRASGMSYRAVETDVIILWLDIVVTKLAENKFRKALCRHSRESLMV